MSGQDKIGRFGSRRTPEKKETLTKKKLGEGKMCCQGKNSWDCLDRGRKRQNSQQNADGVHGNYESLEKRLRKKNKWMTSREKNSAGQEKQIRKN